MPLPVRPRPLSAENIFSVLAVLGASACDAKVQPKAEAPAQNAQTQENQANGANLSTDTAKPGEKAPTKAVAAKEVPRLAQVGKAPGKAAGGKEGKCAEGGCGEGKCG